MKLRSEIHAIVPCLLAASAAAASAEPDLAQPFTGELSLILHKALPAERGGTVTRQHLLLELQADGGRWQTVWGSGLGYGNSVYAGQVCSAGGPDGSLLLDIDGRMGDDRYTRGGRGAFRVALKSGRGDAVAGTFTGTFRGTAVTGAVSGERRPLRPPTSTVHKPAVPLGHPRMLFRAGDVPALREKLTTPLGQAYLAAARQSGDIVSLGMLYQFTGDKGAAEQARKIIESYNGEVDPNPAGSGSTGHRLVEVAFAYDLCCGAWPDAFRRELCRLMLDVIKERQHHLHPGHANYHPCSNYYGPSHGSAALAGLAIWGEKGPAPVEPAVPFAAAGKSPDVAPAAGYRPGKGVPVSAFASGQMPPEWIYAGGFKPPAGADVLAGLGGAAKARPEVGSILTCAGRSETFRPLSHETDRGYWQGNIDITNAIGRIYNSTSCFYTVIDSNAPRWVRMTTDYDPAEAYLAGVRLRHGAVVHLDKGLYPLLVAAPQGELPPWGRALTRPRLTELTEAEAKALIADTREGYEYDRRCWQADRKAWEDSGGIDPELTRYAEMARYRVYLHIRLGVGDGGFQAETGSYALIGTWYPLVYAAACRTMFCRDVSPHPDIALLMPRRMMQVVFGRDGRQHAQKINSVVGFEPRWAAAAMPIVPARYRPALLWAWNWAAGVTDVASAGKVIPPVGDRKATGTGLALAHAFVNYPLAMKPAAPADAMPPTWQASDFGYYCFRSGWQGGEEFIAQAFLKALPVMGWNHGNGGTFGLLGLGRTWVASADSRNGVRPQEPVVWLPDDKLNDSGCAHLTHLTTAADGSGNIAFDLGDIYADANSRGLYDRNLVRWPENFVASGVTGLRAMAFDFSGAGGAPCLGAIVDRIRGGGRKEWLWQVPEADKRDRSAIEPAVRVEGATFTIQQGDAALKATFLAPAGVRLDYAVENIKVGDPRHGFHGAIRRVKAVGGDDFFVVFTVQRGAAPDVKVEGAGLKAVATVGRRKVSFDGEKIVLAR